MKVKSIHFFYTRFHKFHKFGGHDCNPDNNV